ncbi:MAG TPA: hypothetical protein PLE30_06910 [Candidatus Kapabacteria bacterium]|nr:hypothetical protein [Candidatus Kapabacteria bacterium]
MKIKCIYLVLLLLNCNLLLSQTTGFSFLVGPSFPNSEVTELFPNRIIETTDTSYSKLFANYNNPNIGYNISIRGGISLSEMADFYGGLGLHKFKVSTIELNTLNINNTIGSMEMTTTVFPISAGINYYIFRNKFGVYFNGTLDYNYSIYNLDKIDSKYILKLSKSTASSSLGFTLGIGTALELGKAAWIIEVDYATINFLQNSTNNVSKNIISLKTGLKF